MLLIAIRNATLLAKARTQCYGVAMKLSHKLKLQAANLWPPFRGMGIRLYVSEDRLHVVSTLKLRFWNRNIVGTQFGGSLYAMVDPVCMLILMQHIGRDYIVWDKAATIRFKRPGRTDVRAEFSMTPEQVAEIRAQADAHDKVEPQFTVPIYDREGNVVAEVDKLLSVRRKDKVPEHYR